MSMSNEQLEKKLIGLYDRVIKLATVMREGFDSSGKVLQLFKEKIEKLEQAQAERESVEAGHRD